MRICEAPSCNCVCHKLGRISHCEHCEQLPESESENVHLAAPMTPKNYGANIYCPVEKEFTKLFLGHSADGMEVYACGACREPEPELKNVSDVELDAIYKKLYPNE